MIPFQMIISVTLGCVLILALLSRSQDKYPNLALSICIACAVWNQYMCLLKLDPSYAGSYWVYGTTFPVSIVSSIAFYSYCLALTHKSFQFRQLSILHAIPLVASLLWFAVMGWYSNHHPMIEWYTQENYLRLVIGTAVRTAYLVATFINLRRYEKQLCDVFSFVNPLNLFWLRLLFSAYLVGWIVLTADIITGPEVRLLSAWLNLVPVTIFAISFFALRHSIVFLPIDLKDSKPNISETDLKQYVRKLSEFLKEERPYLSPELDLTKLSESLNLTTNQLSEVINRGFNENFYNLINRHRTEESKKRLLDPKFKHMNLLGIAMDCGFNSKSTFNATFKKFTGMTPSEFRDNSVT